jgi:NTP pyrophosphatase (non-canonical NTP hydrolase)
MQANEYNKLALRTLNTYDGLTLTFNDITMINAALGLSGEAGELIEQIKKHLFHGHNLDHAKFLNELGDVLWYLTILASSIGHTLNDVMVMNVNKLSKRYPEGFSSDSSILRVDTLDDFPNKEDN